MARQRSLIANLQDNHRDIDYDERSTLEKLFGAQLSALRRGPLARLKPGLKEYELLIAQKLMDWQGDKVMRAKALAQFLCRGQNRLLVVVFDNCDKRDRDLQLAAFDGARWLQAMLLCLIILPIRDVTYRLYADVPPLDTKIKDLVFRIEPPRFVDVLHRRIELVLQQLTAGYSGRVLRYELSNKIRVEYPHSELGVYLASILYSLYRHDKLIRGVLLGIAARNVRVAMEIFLEFCRSGHIGEKEFLKIWNAEGQYSLGRALVNRVLLRRSRRYYEGDESFVKNVFQCDPSDAAPDNLVRMSILSWLDAHSAVEGPTHVPGFHRCRELLQDLAVFGHDIDRLRKEVEYLVKEACILTEHQRAVLETENDLIALSPGGHVHVTLFSDPT